MKLPRASRRRGNAIACHGCDGNLARNFVVWFVSLARSSVSVSDGTMIIFSSRIVLLRVGEVFPHSRRVQIATFFPSYWTLFHHAAAAALAVRTVPIAMIEPPVFGLLMTKTPVAEAAPARFAPAPR